MPRIRRGDSAGDQRWKASFDPGRGQRHQLQAGATPRHAFIDHVCAVAVPTMRFEVLVIRRASLQAGNAPWRGERSCGPRGLRCSPPISSQIHAVDERGGPESRRVTWAPHAPAGTHGSSAVPSRARLPTAPERVDRVSGHTASGIVGCPVFGDPPLLRPLSHLGKARPSSGTIRICG
jgi:hypothetical protein